jgi:tetratricopeptide (TPR) repeat protein
LKRRLRSLTTLLVWLGLLSSAGAGVTMGAESPCPAEAAYRAGKVAGQDSQARPHYQRGIDLARQILQTRPDDPGALLWLAANLAGEALTHGKLSALGKIGEIESTLLRLEQIHPDYDHAAAARSLANLYWKAPALISIGSSKKAAAYFDLALRRAPDFPGNQAMAAAFFVDYRDCARARPLALAVANRRDLDGFGPDVPEWRQLAQGALRGCG